MKTIDNDKSGKGLPKTNPLRRDLGTFAGFATIMGTMIGSGLFVVTGQGGDTAGPAASIAYLILLPILLSTTMAYAVYMSTPLGNRPGGAYIHISRTFKILYIPYLLLWLQWIAYIGALGVISLSIGQYANSLIPSLNPKLLGSIALVLLCLINIVGVKWYGRFQNIMFGVKMVVILILVLPGLFFVKMSNYSPFMPHGWGPLLAIIPTYFFSYAGFEALASVAGETKSSQKTLPKVFIWGVIFSILVFALVSYVAFGIVPAGELASSKSGMVLVAAHYLPKSLLFVVVIGIIMAFLTALNATLLVPSRVLYVLSEDHLIPNFLSKVNKKTATPVISLTITTIITIIMLWTGTFTYMLNVTLQSLFLMYAVHSLALATLPYIRPNLYDTARIKMKPWILTVIGLFSFVMMLIMSYSMILSVLKLLVFWIVIGTAIYLYARWRGKQDAFDYNALYDAELNTNKQLK